MTRGKARWVGLLAAALLPACAAGPEPRSDDYVVRRLGTDEKVSLASLRGQVVMLNVWATWCGPCREEMPAFQRLHERYGTRGLRIVGVNIDDGQGDGAVDRYVRTLGLTFEIWRDPDVRFQKRFRTWGVPETVLIDRSGTVVRHWRGAIDPNAAEHLSSIHAALGIAATEAPPASGSAAPDLVRKGRRLADQRGCTLCHSLDGKVLQGPTWRGAAGKAVVLADGRTLTRDRAYLARAISEPDAEIVSGYPQGLMSGSIPGGALTPAEIDALVTYIASLSVEP